MIRRQAHIVESKNQQIKEIENSKIIVEYFNSIVSVIKRTGRQEKDTNKQLKPEYNLNNILTNLN